MFFEIITHEQGCLVRVLSPEFEKRLRKLGSWVEVPARDVPIFSLDTAEGFRRYK